MIGIYKITNKINKKCYIGKSNNIKRRFSEHKCIYHETNKCLKKAYLKYGKENFDYEILEECSLEELNEKEMYWISKLKPEYNLTFGGDGATGHKLSSETIEKLRVCGKQTWNNLPEEKKKQIIENNLKTKKGHFVSESTKEKLRQCNLGKKQTKATIDKRKITMIKKKINGYVQTNETHKKKIICLETKEIYQSVKDAGQALNVTPSCISGVLKGRYKTCKNKHFEYYQDNKV